MTLVGCRELAERVAVRRVLGISAAALAVMAVVVFVVKVVRGRDGEACPGSGILTSRCT